jgi:phosphomevalonate kinase
MIACAPGKVVLSGAYAVLYGAPAIVSAVDLYVRADSKKKSDFVTPEVRVALHHEEAPCFDATALRRDGRKVGLGSSAAILVASIAARHPELVTRDPKRRELFQRALVAHREGQGGGSGVDVLASVYGGTNIARLRDDDLSHSSVTLPGDLHVELWVAPSAASTAQMLSRVNDLAQSRPTEHEHLITELSTAAEAAVEAVNEGDSEALLQALATQRDGLADLGVAAGIPIVTKAVQTLAKRAEQSQAVVLPAGAGGGDVVLYVGYSPPDKSMLRLAEEMDHRPLGANIHARALYLEGTT